MSEKSEKSGDQTIETRGADPLEALKRFGLADSFLTYARAMRPETFLRTSGNLFFNLIEVAGGTSEIAPGAKDKRFADETWRTSPGYKRLAQAYLAMSDAIEAMIPEDLPANEKARAEFAAAVFTSTVAPTNTLLGNPAALKRTFESGGQNLVKGAANFWRDVVENEGMPAQVDDSEFEVGKNLAVTPGAIVLRTDIFELIHYKPTTDEVKETPVMLIPPPIGKYYFTDLAPGRSYAEYTVSQGLQYFTISWKNPTAQNRDWGIEAYVAAVIEAIDAVCEITKQPKINLVGFCAGGMLTSMALAYFAAKKQDVANTATLCVTMMDFEQEGSIGGFRIPAMLAVAKAQSQIQGIHRGKDLAKIFTWLRPNDLVWNYWVNNYLMGDSPPAFDILAWNKDGTNLPARLHTEFLDMFKANSLATPGALEILGEKIDLSKVDCDRFVLGAITDHLTPWKGCYESAHMLDGDCTFALSNGGHIAALVNPPGNPKAHHWIGPKTEQDPDQWLEGAQKTSGSWWESWTVWCANKSGKNIVAPDSLGCDSFAPLCEAPGEYVREPCG